MGATARAALKPRRASDWLLIEKEMIAIQAGKAIDDPDFAGPIHGIIRIFYQVVGI
jgi:hypothetical protein